MRTTFTAHVQHLLFQQEFNSELYTITELEDLGDGNYTCDMTRKFSDGRIGYIILNFMNEKFVVDFSITLPDCTITYIVDSKNMYGSTELFSKAVQAIIPLWNSVHFDYKNVIEHTISEALKS